MPEVDIHLTVVVAFRLLLMSSIPNKFPTPAIIRRMLPAWRRCPWNKVLFLRALVGEVILEEMREPEGPVVAEPAFFKNFAI